MVYLALGDIVESPYQPRQAPTAEGIQDLAGSIRENGVIQPIVVRPGKGTGIGTQYELIAGERRWRAASLAGLDRIPAIIRDVPDQVAAEWALIENVQREDLTAMERAWALESLARTFGLTHEEVGDRVGLNRSSVANLIRLTELERDIQYLIAREALSGGHGKALLAMAPGLRRVRLARQAAKEQWSVRQLERMVRPFTPDGEEGPRGRVAGSEKNPALADLEKRLGEYLGTKVTISADRKGEKGKVSFAFYGLDHFDGLMERIGYRERD